MTGMRAAILTAADILSTAKSVRIISHHDADGAVAAGLLCWALQREDITYRASLWSELSIADIGRGDVLAICDMGSGQIGEIQSTGWEHVIVCDHHVMPSFTPSPPGIVHINPCLWGLDGCRDACASTLAFLVARAMDERNADLIPLTLAGIVGDRQHLHLSGPNKAIVDEGLSRGLIKRERGPLIGGHVGEYITKSVDPFFKGLSGRPKATEAFLSSLGSAEDKELISHLTQHLLRQGARPEAVRELEDWQYWLPPFGVYVRELSTVLGVCARSCPDEAIAICLGDREAWEHGRRLSDDYDRRVLRCLIALERGAIELRHIQYFYAERGMGGICAGLGMSWLLNQEKATLALSSSDDLLKVSSRGTPHLVKKGLNLAEALRSASASVGGYGGGHPIAAGATAPRERERDFLDLVDQLVGEQLGE